MKNSPILLGRNEHGYFTATGNISCVLLSTLNLLHDIYKVDRERLYGYIENFYRLLGTNSESIAPFRIPKTIEDITDGEYYSQAVSPNAVSTLRECGYKNPEKYALNQGFVEPPAICASANANAHLGHMVALLRTRDNGREFLIIDNGNPMWTSKQLEFGAAFHIKKST